jgi:hypothetical protein
MSVSVVLIDVAPVADFDHQDNHVFIVNGVDNSVDALPHAVPVLAGQFLTARWVGIRCQHFDALEDTGDILIGDTSQVFCPPPA